ncbi:hypothetical protein D3C76_1725100 [compost metagenome]
MFVAIVFPHDVAIPVHLNQVHIILNTELWISSARASQHITSGENLGRKSEQSFPEVNFLTVHIN